MKVILEKVSSDSDEGARIRAKEITDEIRAAADLLEGHGKKIPVTLKGEEMPPETLMISTDSIYYFESVYKRTYAYTRDECYETKYRLYDPGRQLFQMFQSAYRKYPQDKNGQVGGRRKDDDGTS